MSGRGGWHWLDGSVRLRILGGLGERFLNECAQLDAVMEHVTPLECGFELDTAPQDVKLIRIAARKCRCEVQIIARRGAPFRLRRFRKRWGIAAGTLLGLFVLLWQPRAVWNIDFYNFTQGQEKQLRELLYREGVCEGVQADIAQLNVVESRIVSELPEYSWLQLNFVHGRLVAEKTDASTAPDMQVQEELTSLIASREGIIRGFDLRGGYIQVQPGQSVAQGELLVNAATVGKRTGKILYSAAVGCVWAQTQSVYRCFIPYESELNAPTGKTVVNRALITPLGRFPLGKTQTPENTLEQVSAQPVTLLGLHLPATLETQTLRICCQQTVSLSAAQAADIARSRIYDSLHVEAPECEILSRTESVEESEEGVLMTMNLTLLENIARQVPYTSEMEPEIPAEFG